MHRPREETAKRKSPNSATNRERPSILISNETVDKAPSIHLAESLEGQKCFSRAQRPRSKGLILQKRSSTCISSTHPVVLVLRIVRSISKHYGQSVDRRVSREAAPEASNSTISRINLRSLLLIYHSPRRETQSSSTDPLG